MKLISLHQPWASLTYLEIPGSDQKIKGYETRGWDTDYRGPVLIHSTARCDRARLHDLINHPLIKPLIPEGFVFPFGSIVAVADITECRKMSSFIGNVLPGDPDRLISINKVSLIEKVVGEWQSGRFAFKLENVRKLEPIPFKARQAKLLDVGEEIEQQVLAQVSVETVTPLATPEQMELLA